MKALAWDLTQEGGGEEPPPPACSTETLFLQMRRRQPLSKNIQIESRILFKVCKMCAITYSPPGARLDGGSLDAETPLAAAAAAARESDVALWHRGVEEGEDW